MYLNKIFKSYYLEVIIILTIFSLDRASKQLVIYYENININSEIYLSKYLNIYLIWNEGIAFGFFSFSQSEHYNMLTFLIILVVIFLFYLVKKSDGIKKYSLLMVIGGAFGNLFDRIVYKAVPDFIDFHIEDFHWFIFNVADIFITAGIFFMIFLELIDSNKKKL